MPGAYTVEDGGRDGQQSNTGGAQGWDRPQAGRFL